MRTHPEHDPAPRPHSPEGPVAVEVLAASGASAATNAPPTPGPPAAPVVGAGSGTTDLRRLRLYVALAHDPHFGRTARRQHVSQPTLSAQIKRLERELGVQLFVRDGRGSRLSAAGKALLPRAVELLAHADRMNALASRLGHGPAAGGTDG